MEANWGGGGGMEDILCCLDFFIKCSDPALNGDGERERGGCGATEDCAVTRSYLYWSWAGVGGMVGLEAGR